MVELRGAGCAYGEVVALAPTDLTFDASRTTALVGPSGCGKSTLLRLVLGLVPPSGGEVRVDGEAVTPATAERLRPRIGYVVQDGGLFPHLTAADNAALMARHLGRDPGAVHARLAELAELTRLPREALARYPGELSGGQRQRVGLMRALFLAPPLLLMDEPLGALDPMVRAALQVDLKRILAEGGQTAILVTHDLAEAAFLADRLVLMRAGRVVQSGRFEDFRDAPAEPFVSEFLGAQRPAVAW